MTLPQYLALLDTLLRAAALEDAKAAQGPDAMARWAPVAVPRWQVVSAQLTAAELAQPAETWGWYLAWRDEQHRAGRWRYPGVSGPETGQGDELAGQGAMSVRYGRRGQVAVWSPLRPAHAMLRALHTRRIVRYYRRCRSSSSGCEGAMAKRKQTRKARRMRDTLQNTEQKKQRFLGVYAERGTVTAASKAVQIEPKTHRDWLARDEPYAAAFVEAKQEAAEHLEAEARRRAVEGTLKPIYQGGVMVGKVREYSDTLLIFLMKGAMPDKYRERYEHTGANGAPLPTTQITVNLLDDTELARRMQAILPQGIVSHGVNGNGHVLP